MQNKLFSYKIFNGLIIGLTVIVILLFFLLLIIYIRYPLLYKHNIEAESLKYNIKPEIIASIINVESNYNPNALSNKGAVGLMQILPTTANYVIKLKKLSAQNITNLETPQNNIKIGVAYMDYLLKKFKNEDLAICAYNAGEGNVSSWLKQNITVENTLNNIPFEETKSYLKKFKKNLKVYTFLY